MKLIWISSIWLNYCIITIFISNFGSIFSQTTSYCGSFTPYNSMSCFDYTTNDTLCCYLSAYQMNYYNIFMCYPFNYTDYLNTQGSIFLNGLQYNIDCGTSLGATCGNVNNPLTYLDCSQFSTLSNTCCYYEYQQQTNCVWLDTPSKGELLYNGLLIVCSDDLIKIKYFLLLAIILIFL